jgi:hypothetical protein
MRPSSVAMAVAISVFLAPAGALAAERNSKGDRAKPVAAAGKETSTGLAIAAAAVSAGAKVPHGNSEVQEGPPCEPGPGCSSVPPGKRCDPNDPRPGCQPTPKK